MARRDGRLANQLRPPSMDLRPLLRADGSARFRFGDSTVGGTASPLDGWLVGWKCVFPGEKGKGDPFLGGYELKPCNLAPIVGIKPCQIYG